MKDVVFAKRSVKKVAWLDALRVVVVVAGSGDGNFNQRRAVFRGQANRRQRVAGCRSHSVAGKSGLKLFVGREAAQIHRWLAVQQG